MLFCSPFSATVSPGGCPLLPPHLVRLMPHPTLQGKANEDRYLGFIRSVGTDTLIDSDCSTSSMSQKLREGCGTEGGQAH